MCVMSMVMGHYDDEWSRRLQQSQPATPSPWWPFQPSPVTQQEVDEFRRLLERAREYDRQHNEPDCELESKRERIRALAKELGVEVNFV